MSIEMKEAQLQEMMILLQEDFQTYYQTGKDGVLNHVTERIHQVKQMIEGYRIEFKALNNDDKKVYREKLREHLKNLKQFEQDYEKAKCIDTEKKGGDTTESLVKHGNRLLDEDDRRLRGILTTVEETKQMGMDITDQLAQQTKQLEHINDEVYEINDEMKRSKAILVRMLRRVASNKYLWVMIVLIMMAIIFIIVWKVVKE